MSFNKLLVQSIVWRSNYFLSVLLVNIFLSRFLEASLAGWLYYTCTVWAFVQLLVGLCLETGITFFLSNKKISSVSLLWFCVAWCCIITLLLFATANLFSLPTVQHNKQYMLFMICYIIGLLLTNYSLGFFYAEKNFILPNVILIAFNICFFLLIPKQKQTLHFSINTILVLYFAQYLLQGLTLIIVLLMRNKAWKNIWLPTFSAQKKLLHYSLTALSANIIFFLVYRIDYWFINRASVCTAADLGNYIQASKMGQMLLILPQIIASAIFPQVASGDDKEAVYKAITVLPRLFLQLFIIIFFIAALTGNFIFPWLFGHSFHAMQVPFLLLLPGIFCLSVLTILSSYFGGKGLVLVNVKGAFLAFVVISIADFFFIPVYGIQAAAIISSIGYAVNAGYAIITFYKKTSVEVYHFFCWKKDDYKWLLQLITKKTNN